ncbi:MAG: PAS domain S-box protein, partial [Acidobacteriota bacterium]
MTDREVPERVPSSEGKQLQLSLSDLQTLRTLVDNIAEGTYVATHEGRIVDANLPLLEMLGAETLEDLRDHYGEKLWVASERRAEFERLVSERGSMNEYELEARRLDGKVITVLDTCHVRRSQKGEAIAFYGVLLDISDRKTHEQQLEELSVRDSLTGCYNRRYLQKRRPALERPSHFWGCLML